MHKLRMENFFWNINDDGNSSIYGNGEVTEGKIQNENEPNMQTAKQKLTIKPRKNNNNNNSNTSIKC